MGVLTNGKDLLNKRAAGVEQAAIRKRGESTRKKRCSTEYGQFLFVL
jgi:hypothetical protein